ncbi:hypothetical protein KCP73_13695 [Salmonella enterica subsp. enterica]|nr:hypothetical protein KCP73_13695 [Salmonella enterica subsp. enterica]
MSIFAGDGPRHGNLDPMRAPDLFTLYRNRTNRAAGNDGCKTHTGLTMTVSVSFSDPPTEISPPRPPPPSRLKARQRKKIYGRELPSRRTSLPPARLSP